MRIIVLKFIYFLDEPNNANLKNIEDCVLLVKFTNSGHLVDTNCDSSCHYACQPLKIESVSLKNLFIKDIRSPYQYGVNGCTATKSEVFKKQTLNMHLPVQPRTVRLYINILGCHQKSLRLTLLSTKQ